jgi:hypothetical protein
MRFRPLFRALSMTPLNELFDVFYGHKLDLNKMRLLPISKGGIRFVGRSSENLGVTAAVAPLKSVEPYEAGLITVALGGTKLLSAFVQESKFYTAQNVAILRPKEPMTFAEKLFMCLCIRRNRYRYSAFGREANRSLKDLLVPERSEFPNWGSGVGVAVEQLAEPMRNNPIPSTFDISGWKYFELQDLFSIERGRGPRKSQLDGEGGTPFVTSSDSNNGWTGFTSMTPCHTGNTLGVNRNGSVGEAFYQPFAFCSTEDVHIFTPKFKMNPFIAMFLTALIRKERFRFGYGRKWGIDRMKRTRIKLPVKNDGRPDWKYMERYIKSMPFSSQVETVAPTLALA